MRFRGLPSVNKNETYQISRYAHDLAAKELEKKTIRGENVLGSGRINVYSVGDIVYLQRRFVSDKGHKLKHPFGGPFRVTHIAGNTMVLKCLNTGKIKRASMRDINIFKGDFLTKTNNKNVGSVFPVHDQTNLDLLSNHTLHPQDKVTSRQKGKLKYDLRSKVA